MPPRRSTIVPRFACFGFVVLLLAAAAVVTGVILWPFYHADAGGAHASVSAIQASPPLRLVRAAHHWASALCILVGLVWLVYSLFLAAYRRPWQLAWVAAVCLVGSFVVCQLTGHALPWDVHGVSTVVAEAGIAENVPGIGPLQARLVRGGDAVSPHTLSLWYTLHVALLPVFLLALGGYLYSRLRAAGAPEGAPRAAFIGALAVLALLALVAPVPLGPPATERDYTNYSAPPEWYILPMHGLLNLVQRIDPKLAFVGTMVIPGVAVLLLLALPWIDRRRVDEPLWRPVLGIAALGTLAVAVLTLLNVDHMAPLFSSPHFADSGPVHAAPVQLDPQLVAQGKQVYTRSGCMGCHKLGGAGGASGPPLDGEATRHPDLDWQMRHLKNPPAVVPGSMMPPYAQLSDADLRALAQYLVSLK